MHLLQWICAVLALPIVVPFHYHSTTSINPVLLTKSHNLSPILISGEHTTFQLLTSLKLPFRPGRRVFTDNICSSMDQISSERGFGSKETSSIVGDITKLIGNTPMTRLNRVTKTCLAEVAVKLEVMQPTMSIKDRMALGMIAAAEDRYSRFISTHHVQLTVALKLSTEAIYAQERQR
jgi:hypothetical protein